MRHSTNAAARLAPLVILAVLGLVLSLFASARPVLSGVEMGTIAVFKTMCQQVGQQDTCNGRDTSLSDYNVDFQVYSGSTPTGTVVQTITVTLSDNDQGTGNVGNGSQGRNTGSPLLIGTYTVCEVPTAYKTGSPDVALDPYPRPTASQGGSSGGGNQAQTPNTNNCITVNLTGGEAELKFLDLRGPQITVAKTGDTLSKIGDTASYSVTVTNTSQFTVYKQSITDSLKGDLTADAGCGASLAAGASCTISYNMTVPAAAADPLPNTVTAVYDRNEALDGTEATAGDGHSVNLFQPSLTVTKTASPATVSAGGPVAYFIMITNTSSTDSPSLVLDTISDSLKGNLMTGSGLTSTCGATLAAGTACTIGYSLGAGTTPGERCNDVTVTSHPQDFPNNITGSARACVQVVGGGTLGASPLLVIDKVASTETITISGPTNALVATPSVVTWTLSYTLTSGPATGVVITDPIPTGFTFLDAADGGTATGGTVTWNLGTVSASGSVSFRTTVNPITIPRTGQTNVATIDSTETTPDTGQDSVTVVVQAPPLASTGGPSSPTGSGVPNTATTFGAEGSPISALQLLGALALAVGIGRSMMLGARTSRRR